MIIKIYIKDGSSIKIAATDVELNRLMDELLIKRGDAVIARFFTSNIAGYEMIQIPIVKCGDD